MLEEEFLDYTASEFDKAWKNAALEIDQDLFPIMSQSENLQDMMLDFDLDLDDIDWGSFDLDPSAFEKHNVDEPNDNKQNSGTPAFDSLSDTNMNVMAFAPPAFTPQQQQQAGLLLDLEIEDLLNATASEAMVPVAPAQPIQQEQVAEQEIQCLQSADSVSPTPPVATRSSRRKTSLVVRDFADSLPSTPQSEETAAVKPTRGRKRKASDSTEPPVKRRSKAPAKPKKEKMWEKKDDPKARDARLARERREKKKKELAAAKARIQELENDIVTNYIHKNDTDGLTNRMMELGIATMAEDGQDRGVAQNSAEVEASTTGTG